MGIQTTARPAAPRSVAQQGGRGGFAEAGIVLIALYALLGAGIGSACGSLLIGMLCGLLIGVFAVGAILLISGSAQGESGPVWRREGSRSKIDSSL